MNRRPTGSQLCELEVSGEVRLPPISGGLFAGQHSADLPRLTWESIGMAARRMQPRLRGMMMRRIARVRLCIFTNTEADAYEAANRAAY